MLFEELKNKAAGLPHSPGVYIMRDQHNSVIYVGKAKILKNRVSQYFQDTASHTPKTRLMVSKIHNFDVIVANSEFEALILECSLIKQHIPKYNILLKDDKGFPYIRLNTKERYPRITLANKTEDDGALYFGPYGSRGTTRELIETICSALRLPQCKKIFPKDFGKDRPCLHYHMNQCEGWCLGNSTAEDYKRKIEQARQLLQGNYKQVAAQIKKQMLEAAEELNFELAAGLRDQLKSVESLGKKQMVTGGVSGDTDVVGFFQNSTKACFVVLHYNDGKLVDKYFSIVSTADDESTAVSSLLTQYYLIHGYVPKTILLPFDIADDELFVRLMAEKFGRRPALLTPKRGDKASLVNMAKRNAMDEVERITSKEEKAKGAINLLGRMLGIATPERIESFDVSNISGTDIVASMVVFVNGKPARSEYKRYALQDMDGQDDYASMEQVLHRRFTRLLNADPGFEKAPGLLLIDGGIAHAQIAVDVLNKLQISVPVFGMVKDDRHRTRALVTPEGAEIRIDAQQAVFSFVGTIQEETHRFAITYHRNLRSKRLKYSELDGIPGIGPKRKQILLKHFKSITAIKDASTEDLLRVLPADAANSVYHHYHSEKGE